MGRLSTEKVELLIRPKCSIPSLLMMLAEAYELSDLAPELAGYETSPEIVDLLVQVFLRQVNHIARLGLKRGYVPREDRLLAVRGRVNIRRSLALHLRGQPQVDCSYEDFTLDVLENQSLLLGLRAVAANNALPSLRRSLAYSLSGEFLGVREIAVDKLDAGHIRCDRLNQHYEPALRMAHLILRKMGIEQEFGQTKVNGFTLNMNQLFEEFVARKLEKILRLASVSVTAQKKLPFDRRHQAHIQPDLIIQSFRGRRVVADTKYKLGESPVPSDLYQMLAYCRVLKVPWGILITAGEGSQRLLEVNDEVTTIAVVPIDLSTDISAIEQSLKRLAELMLSIVSAKA